MPFQEYLQSLVDSIPDAEGAVMVAFDGEPVAEALSRAAREDGRVDEVPLDRYGLQLLGAQLRSIITILERTHEEAQLDPPKSVAIRGRLRSLFVQNLSDKYYILLAVRSGAGVVGAEQKLQSYAEVFNQEM